MVIINNSIDILEENREVSKLHKLNEDRNSFNRLTQLFENVGWRLEFFPLLEKYYMDCVQKGMNETEEGRICRAKATAVMDIIGLVNKKMNVGDYAKKSLSSSKKF